MISIQKLDPVLVNKIAAGEVIERPASVVKELVENAIDAGATRIDVALEEGGTHLIRVTDNGCGVPYQQLPLAIAPHATSKIRTSEDLFNIHSLGFRGEALASIASVSHLRMCSRPAEQIEAYELLSTDSCPAEPKACAAPEGTTVEIRNLFYNMPARRKFLRRPPTEQGHATEQIARLALAHPTASFTMSHNGRGTKNLPATKDRRTRIADFYGSELADCLIDVDRQERDLRVESLLAPPFQSKATSKWQYVFLNGRYITDRRIGFAIREAFRGLVEHGRYPVVFIFLTIPADQFDVNVHPTKIEVRWRDAGLVQSQVLAVLRETLLSHDFAVPLRPSSQANQADRSAQDESRQFRTRQALADYLKSVDPTQIRLDFKPPRFATDNLRPSVGQTLDRPSGPPATGTTPASGTAPPTRFSEQTFEHDESNRAFGRIGAEPQAPSTPDHAGEEATDLSNIPLPPGGIIQVHNAYLVAQTEEGIVIVDQHALHERILYEQFRTRILADDLESQGLLIPATLAASPAQSRAAEQHKDLIKRIGIQLEPFGPDGTLAIQGFPTLLESVDVSSFVADLLDTLDENAGESEEALIHATLDMMACKAAVKAGDPLTTEEMHALLAQRHLTERSSNCPHGRPTTLQISTRDLAKQFKRE